MGISPISSRKRVPPWANSIKPTFPISAAPVKAPFSKPNNSASRRFSGIAAQLISTKGSSRLLLFLWINFANNPFPVPEAPRIKILEAPIWASFKDFWRICFIGMLSAMMLLSSSSLNAHSDSSSLNFLVIFWFCSYFLRKFSSSVMSLSLRTMSAILPFSSRAGVPVHKRTLLVFLIC
ncbi:MAG: hypothetical protein ACD_77C00213G0001 [uncultured bacterium]|nr:MAG: hypothetical protein ACD_77C00213G0001 [uncultured bacterium]